MRLWKIIFNLQMKRGRDSVVLLFEQSKTYSIRVWAAYKSELTDRELHILQETSGHTATDVYRRAFVTPVHDHDGYEHDDGEKCVLRNKFRLVRDFPAWIRSNIDSVETFTIMK